MVSYDKVYLSLICTRTACWRCCSDDTWRWACLASSRPCACFRPLGRLTGTSPFVWCSYERLCAAHPGHLNNQAGSDQELHLLAESGVTAQNTDVVERRVLEEVCFEEFHCMRLCAGCALARGVQGTRALHQFRNSVLLQLVSWH